MNSHNTINTKYSIECFNAIKSSLKNTQLHHEGGYLHVGNNRVYAEYLDLIEVPFSRFVSIRFKLDRYKYSKEKQGELISDCLRYINKSVRERYPDKVKTNRSVRCILKREIGKSLEGDMHVHLLLLVDERVRDLIEKDVDELISHLTEQFEDELEPVVFKPIKDKEIQISYFCKIDPKLDWDFEHLLGLKKIIRKFYPRVPRKILPLSFIRPEEINPDSEDYEDSILNQTDEIKNITEMTKAA